MCSKFAATVTTHSQQGKNTNKHLRRAQKSAKKCSSKFGSIPISSCKVTRQLQMKYCVMYYAAASRRNPAAQSAIARGRPNKTPMKHKNNSSRATLSVCPPFRSFTDESSGSETNCRAMAAHWFFSFDGARSLRGSPVAYTAGRSRRRACPVVVGP